MRCQNFSYALHFISSVFEVFPPGVMKQTMLEVTFPAECVDMCNFRCSAEFPSTCSCSLVIQILLIYPVASRDFGEVEFACVSSVPLIIPVANSVAVFLFYHFLSLCVKNYLYSHPLWMVHLIGGNLELAHCCGLWFLFVSFPFVGVCFFYIYIFINTENKDSHTPK